MVTTISGIVARRAALLGASLAIAALSRAGDLTFTAGSWSGLTGTAASSPSLVTTSAINPVATLGVKATSSGTQTLRGVLSFTIDWIPASAMETPPTSVLVTFRRAVQPTVAGTGVAKISTVTSGPPPVVTDLLSVDSTTLILSGITAYLDTVTVIVPISLQPSGLYEGTGSLTSEQISATYDSSTSTQTSMSAIYTVAGLEAL